MASIVYDLSLVNKTVDKNYTFKDISPVDIDDRTLNGDVPASYDGRAVQNGINNMFLFARGERVLQPEFGNSLYKYLMEPVTILGANKIAYEIRQMFNRWEPRVEILDTAVVPLPDDHMYHVAVLYTIPALSKNNVLKFQTAVNQRR